MDGYLGEISVEAKATTKYKHFTAIDWALLFIAMYGQIDGAHHKQWVLDQVARILNGTKVNIKLARWENGEKEYRFTTDKPSKQYKDWVRECKGKKVKGEYEYDYDEGIAP